jgi:hypothetical protein
MPNNHRFRNDVSCPIARVGRPVPHYPASSIVADSTDIVCRYYQWSERNALGCGKVKRVMPAVLQNLMRHASIQTTMQFYVDLEAEDVADALWQAAPSNAFCNSRHLDPASPEG